jgi:hypothetical protein
MAPAKSTTPEGLLKGFDSLMPFRLDYAYMWITKVIRFFNECCL